MSVDQLVKNPSLCTHTDQVFPINLNGIDINRLCKESVVEWLTNNGYLDTASKIDTCGTTFILLRDKNGHEKYCRLRCKNEFCPSCGAVGSGMHKRRSIRASDRLLWAKLLGYMVFTLPKVISVSRPDTESLSYLSKKAWEIVKQEFEAPGGLVRTHLMGDEPENLHIHLNVLFPITNNDGLGKVPKETLERVRSKWTRVINDFFELKCDKTNVFYKFATNDVKMRHKIKYVLRPVVTPNKFLTLSDQDRHYILSLKGWHNTRWYGSLSNSTYKKYLKEAIGLEFDDLESQKDMSTRSKCPICGEKYEFIEIVKEGDISPGQTRYWGQDTRVDLETFAYISKDS